MPEGPEIRIEADKIRAALEGRTAETVFFAFPRLKRYQKLLSGKTVESVRASGKAILIGIEGGRTIYSHNQLYGRWLICRNGDEPQTKRQLRLAIRGPEKSALLYSASEIEVLKSPELEKHPYLRRLGPDVLNQRVTLRTLEKRFEDPQFRKRSLASLLLDQGFIAGVGNYLRSEILFAAGVHPARRPADLSPQQIKALARSTQRLLKQSHRTRGITNDLDRAQALKADGWPRGEYRFAVFGRGEKSCFCCGEEIIRQSIAGRRCYLCPSCQPL